MAEQYCPTANPGHRLAGQPAFISIGAKCPDPLTWAAGTVRNNNNVCPLSENFFCHLPDCFNAVPGCRVWHCWTMDWGLDRNHYRSRLVACPKIPGLRAAVHLSGSVCLFGYGGTANRFSPLLMICGSGFALAAWDLIFLDDTLGTNSFGEQTRQYENKHLQALALALGCGLIVAFVGRLLNFQIPFIVMMLFVALVIFGLERIWSTIKKRNIH